MEHAQDIQDFIEGSMEGLRLQTEAHQNLWHLGEEEQWNVDLQQGQIRWTFADGTVAVANIQVVGTFNPQDSTFLWGWDHPSVPPALRDHAEKVRVYGEEHQIPTFTERTITCTELQAWEFTAVAARLGGASGAYRGNAGGPLVFMTFGEVQISRT
ncbi:DUF6882 domain-containing protein [Deinococcus cellulosilyticus]|nr:DUF6882 domain-containing protein [Deinococcus cellulosilyticus]